ncbi:MAG: phosphotransferase [Gammaproteobacteria bacterium]|nr:phosphotransferase [Gammaproteobacteria bacterium]
MAVITRLTHSAVESILENYEVGRLIRLTPVAQGIENTNYFVQTSTSPDKNEVPSEFVLTVIEDDRLDQREIMFQTLEACTDYGLPVARFVRTKEGNSLSTFRDKAIMLSVRLSGRNVTAPASEQCRAIGRFLSRMHHATDDLDAERFSYVRDAEWIQGTATTVIGHLSPGDRLLLQTAVQAVCAMLSRKDVQSLPQGVIHGDLFRDNALFNQFGLTGVVDFHHAAYGFRIYDVAVAVNDWCRSGDALDQRRTIALLQAYNQIRPFESEEYWFFDSFLLYAALAFWLSRLSIAVQENLPDGQPVREPQEMKRLVQQHLSRPYRLHELALAS